MFGINAVCALTQFILVVNGAEVWQNQQVPRYHAVATLRTADNNAYLMGQIQFLQYYPNAPTTLMGLIQFPAQSFRDQYLAVHIHEYGDITEGCRWIGRHYNPHGQQHGAPTDQVRHVGDLGNISPTGLIALVNITDPHIQLVGINTVVGRSLVVHVKSDDYGRGFTSNSKIDGNSGYPLACGTIAIKGDFSPAAAFSIGPACFVFYLLCAFLTIALNIR